MGDNKLAEKIKSMCSGKCYRCKECMNEVKSGNSESEFYFCRYDDESKNITPSFPQVFQAMRKLAKDGIELYQSAIEEYIVADEDRKAEMQKWLMEGLSIVNFDDMSLTTALFLMQYE